MSPVSSQGFADSCVENESASTVMTSKSCLMIFPFESYALYDVFIFLLLLLNKLIAYFLPQLENISHISELQ
jgi:hypothetical protein